MPTPPKANPVHRKPRVGPIQLPAEGRKGAAPKWPLQGNATPEEKAAWRELWKTPQAVAWEQMGWTRTVARYCRFMIEAERPGASASLLAQVLGLETQLGLTPKAMRLLLWTIVEDEVQQQRETRKQSVPTRRLRAVDPSLIEGTSS